MPFPYSLGRGNETALQSRRRTSKSATPQDGNAKAPQRAKDHAPSHSSAASLHKKVALLTRERDEALEQQTATSEILASMSDSMTDRNRSSTRSCAICSGFSAHASPRCNC